MKWKFGNMYQILKYLLETQDISETKKPKPKTKKPFSFQVRESPLNIPIPLPASDRSINGCTLIISKHPWIMDRYPWIFFGYPWMGSPRIVHRYPSLINGYSTTPSPENSNKAIKLIRNHTHNVQTSPEIASTSSTCKMPPCGKGNTFAIINRFCTFNFLLTDPGHPK